MGRLTIVQADMTRENVDAVVNAANEHLRHGGGVAAAIARAGGADIQRESDAWIRAHGQLAPGQAAVTTAGDMPSRHVVHVVGPRYRPDQDNVALLAEAVRAALDAAIAAGARSVAMPAISTGVFGYPGSEACRVIVDTCRSFLASHPEALEEIRLVGYDDRTVDHFRRAAATQPDGEEPTTR